MAFGGPIIRIIVEVGVRASGDLLGMHRVYIRFPKITGTFLGVPITRSTAYWELHWG